MMRTWGVVLALATSGCRDEPKQAEAKAASVTDRARAVGSDVRERVRAATGFAERQLDAALSLGRRAKVELDKVYRRDTDYALTVDDGSSPDAAAHAARLDAMPAITIGDVRVGYHEDASLSLRGTTYAKHFRASWRRGDQVVRVSYYTQETMNVVAFVALLEKLVPAVERALR